MKSPELRPWTDALACAIGLTLGFYYSAAGVYDLCYGIGPFRPEGCSSGGSLGAWDSSLVGIGAVLALVSLVILVSVVKGSSAPGPLRAPLARSVFVVGISSGILVFLGSSSGICDPFGPFGTTGTTCASFDPYVVIGPVLALVSLIGLIGSFRTQGTAASVGRSVEQLGRLEGDSA